MANIKDMLMSPDDVVKYFKTHKSNAKNIKRVLLTDNLKKAFCLKVCTRGHNGAGECEVWEGCKCVYGGPIKR